MSGGLRIELLESKKEGTGWIREANEERASEITIGEAEGKGSISVGRESYCKVYRRTSLR